MDKRQLTKGIWCNRLIDMVCFGYVNLFLIVWTTKKVGNVQNKLTWYCNKPSSSSVSPFPVVNTRGNEETGILVSNFDFYQDQNFYTTIFDVLGVKWRNKKRPHRFPLITLLLSILHHHVLLSAVHVLSLFAKKKICSVKHNEKEGKREKYTKIRRIIHK